MVDSSRDGEQTLRPSLSTIHSNDGHGQHEQTPVKRLDTAVSRGSPPSPPQRKTSNPLKRADTSKSNRLRRSETPLMRPPLARVPSTSTKYMAMLLHLDEIPRLFNISAGLFTWIILAGFLVVPGTFTTFKESKAFQAANGDDSNEVTHAIVHSIAHIGLLWLSGAFCVVGAVGCLWLWFRWRRNYIWLINKIFMPVTMNSVAGLITTLVNVYTAQHGVWSVTAKVTAIVTGSCVGVGGFLFLVYNFGLLRSIQKTHLKELGLEHQHEDESLVEKVKRKAHEPPLQSGNVV